MTRGPLMYFGICWAIRHVPGDCQPTYTTKSATDPSQLIKENMNPPSNLVKSNNIAVKNRRGKSRTRQKSIELKMQSSKNKLLKNSTHINKLVSLQCASFNNTYLKIHIFFPESQFIKLHEYIR